MESNDTNQFKVKLTQYSGPLDVLLDLAKSQKVNLENISITKYLYIYFQSGKDFFQVNIFLRLTFD